jgi:hypothetical protein
MRRFVLWCCLLALVVSAPAHASSSSSMSITIGNAPPPPVLVFRGEPRLIVVPATGVYYYDGPGDYDYFRYGQSYYIYNGGYWYRAPRARGPFVAIREAYVPRAFYNLDDRGYHWKHGWKRVPPGQVRKMERRVDGHGHKKGHGHNKD